MATTATTRSSAAAARALINSGAARAKTSSCSGAGEGGAAGKLVAHFAKSVAISMAVIEIV
jgi:hypothetical protein